MPQSQSICFLLIKNMFLLRSLNYGKIQLGVSKFPLWVILTYFINSFDFLHELFFIKVFGVSSFSINSHLFAVTQMFPYSWFCKYMVIAYINSSNFWYVGSVLQFCFICVLMVLKIIFNMYLFLSQSFFLINGNDLL